MTAIDREMLVPDDLAGKRIDSVSAILFDDFSRATLSGWIRDGSLKVNGKVVKPKMKLIGGERITLRTVRVAREDWSTAQDINFGIIYEDDDLIVINKPSGLVVHPGAGNRDGTLVNGLVSHRKTLAFLPRAGIVHRLDKNTTGLMLVAATEAAFKKLTSDIQNREVQRHYEAIVEGAMISGGEINRPIGRNPRNRLLKAVRPEGREARTMVSILEKFVDHTVLDITLKTGRTHQIRVHMSSEGFPIVGDNAYGFKGRAPKGASAELTTALRHFGRQALHAKRLVLKHPVTGEEKDFKIEPPPDYRHLVSLLRDDNVQDDA